MTQATPASTIFVPKPDAVIKCSIYDSPTDAGWSINNLRKRAMKIPRLLFDGQARSHAFVLVAKPTQQSRFRISPPDYVLKVIVADIADYDRVHKQLIKKVPSPADVSALFSMEPVKHTTSIEPLA